MDFPLDLNTAKFVYSMDELQQTLTVLLRNAYGTFMQSPKLGSKASVHTDADAVYFGVKETVEQVAGLECLDCKVSLPDVNVSVRYMDEVVNFTFSVDNLQ